MLRILSASNKHPLIRGARRNGNETSVSEAFEAAFRRGAGWFALTFIFALPLIAPTARISGETPGFRYAKPGYRFEFPRDLRPRNGYRTSWWYYTGHLYPESAGTFTRNADDSPGGAAKAGATNPAEYQGKRYGFQFTIFKIENAPNPAGDYRAGNVFFMAHLALTDEKNRKYYFTERLQRRFPGMAGYDAETRTVFVENNTLRIDDSGRKHSIRTRAEGFRLELDLQSALGPLVHGENGISRKGYDARSASHYISIPDLVGEATLTIGAKGPARKLVAKSWMDIEFGSNVLSKTQTGWDWLHVSLENNERYMIFRVRDGAGRDFYSASAIDAAGRIRPVAADRIQMQPGRVWTSPATGARYPVEWKMVVEDTTLVVKPWIDAQEAHPDARAGSRVSYWEGAVDVVAEKNTNDANSDANSDAAQIVRGVGYLEMTGYAGSMGGTL
ncbi:MAG: lipocalin family protein [Leptospirales bacterium]